MELTTEIQAKISLPGILGPKLRLSVRHLDLIKDEGEKGYPDECCGFLFGRKNDDDYHVTYAKPIGNEQTVNRARRFLISPQDFIEAENFARRNRLDLLGFYHSHPDHPAIPSDFDREHALPFYAYAIVSVHKGKSAELRSWRLSDDRTGYEEDLILYRM